MQILFFSLMMLFSVTLSAQGEPDGLPPPPDQGFWPTLITIGVGILFFYLIMWRPEMKRRKELDAKRQGLQQGDKVTAMGIVGTVVRVQDQTVILKMHDGSKLEFLKGAVNEVLPESGEISSEQG